ncbi:MAG: TackOD1 domain-containing metal-binding protein, partial [Thermoproteota archaeon]
LNELVDDEILVKELLETRIICPRCRFPQASIKLECPFCNSQSIKRGEAIEHVACRYCDFEIVFKTPEGKLVCPKCNVHLEKEGADYRKIGFIYKCLVCGESSRTPRKILVCGRCGHPYTDEEGVSLEVYGYFVNEDKREIIEIESLEIDSVIKRLRSYFWNGEASILLKGDSGIEHPFTMVVYRPGDENRILIDMVLEEEVLSEDPVISFLSKTLDFNTKYRILIGVPGFFESAKELTKAYGISVFECSKVDEVVDTLWNAVRPILEEEASKTFMEVAEILETSQVLKGLMEEGEQGPRQSSDIY